MNTDRKIEEFHYKELRSILETFNTPFLLYDLDKVIDNYQRLKEIIKPDYIYYAMKACKLKPILKSLQEVGSGFEVNTIQEFDTALSVGAPVEKLINSAPVKITDHISYMYKKGLTRFAFDSLDEVDKIQACAPGSDVCLRIHTENTGSGQALNTKAGAFFEDAPKILNYALLAGLNPFGLTFTVGSQCENVKNWKEGITKCAKLFNDFPTLTTLDLGGGFPISYENDALKIDKISQEIEISLIRNFKNKPTIFIEPGRYITGNAAITVSSVIGVKEAAYLNWIFMDVSVFGGFLELFEFDDTALRYPVFSAKRGKKYNYNIGGPTCDGCDIIRRNIRLPKIRRGDRLYFLNTGAYTLEYASSFNGFSPPSVYYIKHGKIIRG